MSYYHVLTYFTILNRVDAIQTAEDIRQVNTANRKNPLDDELIKTKGLLRAPSLRRDSSTKKDASTTQTAPGKDEGDKMPSIVQGKDTAEEDNENIQLENVQPVKVTPTWLLQGGQQYGHQEERPR